MEEKQIEQLSDSDKLILEKANSKRHIALAQTEKALAQSEAADISYKYTVLQIYMKYGLSKNDGIDENGKILRNINLEK